MRENVGMLEYWNDGIKDYEKMEKRVTCREPQGRAIGKIPLDREVYKIDREIVPFKTTIPPSHYSIIPLFHIQSRNSGIEILIYSQ
jgi:hypothetical protein